MALTSAYHLLQALISETPPPFCTRPRSGTHLVLSHELLETGSPLVALYPLVAALVFARTLLRTALAVDHAVDALLAAALVVALARLVAAASLRLVQLHRLDVVVHVCNTPTL